MQLIRKDYLISSTNILYPYKVRTTHQATPISPNDLTNPFTHIPLLASTMR